MEAAFWHGKWQRADIGFHIADTNPLLKQYCERLQLQPGSRVFLPLCGKTLDIHWLLAQSYRVVGIDLSELAIRALFQELGVEPEVRQLGPLLHFSAPAMDFYAGDLFSLSDEQLGMIDAVYDRAALVALPPEMRSRYAAHLLDLAAAVPQLLIAYEYQQELVAGPPFAVLADEVARHYAGHYRIELLARVEVAGGIKDRAPACEAVWLLQPAG